MFYMVDNKPIVLEEHQFKGEYFGFILGKEIIARFRLEPIDGYFILQHGNKGLTQYDIWTSIGVESEEEAAKKRLHSFALKKYEELQTNETIKMYGADH